MSKKRQRIHFELNSGDIHQLADREIKAILRAADLLIGTGGRSLLAKLLKGSKDKKILEHQLDQCPTYGYYQDLTLAKIGNRIDWMIKKGYLEIEYSGKLPLLIFSEFGWEIEKDTFAEELFQDLVKILDGNDYKSVQNLKDRNRGMILRLLDKIMQSNNAKFIPLLRAWKEVEYKKVQAEIQKVIEHLAKEGTIFTTQVKEM